MCSSRLDNRSKLFSFRQLLQNLNRPLPQWGPSKPEDRTIPRYQRLSPSSETAIIPPYVNPNAIALSTTTNGSGGLPPYSEAQTYPSPTKDGSYENKAFQRDNTVVTKM